ncbi:MAG: hypothetical protein WA417_07100, partial [Stellaceae bacterium]
MDKSSKRGKIPQQDWPSIITRYEAGETLASIARTYDCSPPAISYIVSRTRARNAAAEAAAPALIAAEPQLIKAPIASAPINSMAAPQSTHNGAAGDSRISIISVADSDQSLQRPDAPEPGGRGLFLDAPPQPRAGEFPASSEIDRPAQPSAQGQPYPQGQLYPQGQPHGRPQPYGQGQRESHGGGNGAVPPRAPNPPSADNPPSAAHPPG